MSESSLPAPPGESDTNAPGPIGGKPFPGSLAGFFRSYLTPAGKTAAWNLGCLVAGTLVSQACGLTVVLLLTQALGPDQFGMYVFAMTLHGYMTMIAAASLGPVVIRELTRRPDDTGAITTSYLTISFTASLLVAIAATVGVQLTTISADERFLITCIALSNLATGARMVPFFDARHRQAVAVAVTTAADILWLTGIAGLFVFQALSIRSAAQFFLARWVMSCLAVFLVYGVMFGWPRLRFCIRELADMLGSSSHLLVTQLATSVPLTSGVVIVRFFHGEAAAGIMGLAVLVVQTFLQLVALVLQIVYPHINSPYGTERLFQRKLWAFFLVYVALVLLAAHLGVLLVVDCFLEPTYATLLSTSMVMLLGGTILACVWLFFQYFFAEHREKSVSAMQLISAAIFLALGLPATRQWSHMGAAAAFVLSAVSLFAIVKICRGRQTTGSNPAERRRTE